MDDAWTLWTARLALAMYFVTLVALLTTRTGPRPAWPRFVWLAGCLVFLVHVFRAFHAVHGWSHADAYAHTARRTEEFAGVASGVGLYLNYVFTAVWLADALWWAFLPDAHRRCPAWMTWALHGFLAFMVFNATVVFAIGPTRWVGLAAGLVLFGLLAHRLLARAAD
jgi:hypothetical protein